MGHTIGFALAKSAEVLGAEPYVHEFVAGVERVLLPHGDALLLQVVPSREEVLATIRRWHGGGHVDAVILIDLVPGDPVIGLVRELGLPAVVIGDPATAEGLPSVWAQDDLVMSAALGALEGLGHTGIGHLSGPVAMAHTRLRMQVLEEFGAGRGVPVVSIEGDYSERSGRTGLVRLLEADPAVTAVVADNDVMAVGALAAARELGIAVPERLSILAWDDSALCQLSSPTLSAMSHDVQGIGEAVGRAVRVAIVGGPAASVAVPVARFVARDSTAGKT